MKLSNGSYTATIEDYGITEFKPGRPTTYIKVHVPVGDQGGVNLVWFGSLSSDRSRAFVLKTLAQLNPEISNVLDILEGPETKKLRVGSEVQIEVENKMNEKTKQLEPRVKYINPGQKKFRRLSQQTLAMLKGQPVPPEEDFHF